MLTQPIQVRLISSNERQSKKGNAFRVLKFADVSTYDSFEIFDFENLHMIPGRDYIITLEVSRGFKSWDVGIYEFKEC